MAQICGLLCCRKREQQNEKLRVETEVSVVQLEQTARMPVKQVSWGNTAELWKEVRCCSVTCEWVTRGVVSHGK